MWRVARYGWNAVDDKTDANRLTLSTFVVIMVIDVNMVTSLSLTSSRDGIVGHRRQNRAPFYRAVFARQRAQDLSRARCVYQVCRA